MLYSSQRIALLGLALGPAVLVLWMAVSGAPEAMIDRSTPFAIVSSVLAILAVWIYGTFPHSGNLFATVERGRPARLLRQSAFRALPSDLPDEKTMRHVLQRALNPHRPSRSGGLISREPERCDSVLAQALKQVMDSWGVTDLRALAQQQVTELYLLHELMMAGPSEAGRMAQHFLKPDQVLLIHEQVQAIRSRRQEFDAQLAVFEATMALWSSSKDRKTSSCDLRAKLEAMKTPDPDLWHSFVLMHDPSKPDHREAALWIVSQPECQQATVAAYLARIVLDGHAEAAARGSRAREDRAFLNRVRRVLEQWNDGLYCSDALGLDPEDMLCGREEDFRAALQRLAAAGKTYLWPMPQDLFRSFPGRAPEPRPAWSLPEGRLVVQPRIGDYVSYLRLKPV